MVSYQFTASANRDLQSIIDYTVESWSAAQAIKYIDKLEELAQLLADNPDVGMKCSELSKELLSFPYESHTLYYFKDDLGITIIRVLHSSMDAVQHF